MATDEPLVDEPAATPTVVERLTRFIDTTLGDQHALEDGIVRELAETILRDFFRVDVEATSIYAIPGVDSDTLAAFAMVHWGPMAGRVSPDELRAIGAAFLETAESADLDASLVAWLLRDPGSNREGAAKILASFREFRAELEAAEV